MDKLGTALPIAPSVTTGASHHVDPMEQSPSEPSTPLGSQSQDPASSEEKGSEGGNGGKQQKRKKKKRRHREEVYDLLESLGSPESEEAPAEGSSQACPSSPSLEEESWESDIRGRGGGGGGGGGGRIRARRNKSRKKLPEEWGTPQEQGKGTGTVSPSPPDSASLTQATAGFLGAEQDSGPKPASRAAGATAPPPPQPQPPPLPPSSSILSPGSQANAPVLSDQKDSSLSVTSALRAGDPTGKKEQSGEKDHSHFGILGTGALSGKEDNKHTAPIQALPNSSAGKEAPLEALASITTSSKESPAHASPECPLTVGQKESDSPFSDTLTADLKSKPVAPCNGGTKPFADKPYAEKDALDSVFAGYRPSDLTVSPALPADSAKEFKEQPCPLSSSASKSPPSQFDRGASPTLSPTSQTVMFLDSVLQTSSDTSTPSQATPVTCPTSQTTPILSSALTAPLSTVSSTLPPAPAVTSIPTATSGPSTPQESLTSLGTSPKVTVDFSPLYQVTSSGSPSPLYTPPVSSAPLQTPVATSSTPEAPAGLSSTSQSSVTVSSLPQTINTTSTTTTSAAATTAVSSTSSFSTSPTGVPATPRPSSPHTTVVFSASSQATPAPSSTSTSTTTSQVLPGPLHPSMPATPSPAVSSSLNPAAPPFIPSLSEHQDPLPAEPPLLEGW